MNAQEQEKLRAKFLTSEERRHLRSLRNWNHKKAHRELSMQPSDYCLFEPDDYLKLIEEYVSKYGWNW
jgi:rubrerythrin